MNLKNSANTCTSLSSATLLPSVALKLNHRYSGYPEYPRCTFSSICLLTEVTLLPFHNYIPMAELTATNLKSQPNSSSSLQQISCPCWCLLYAEHSPSLLNILPVCYLSPESSLAIPAETPGSMNCHFLFSSVLQGGTLTLKNHSVSPAQPIYSSCEQEL